MLRRPSVSPEFIKLGRIIGQIVRITNPCTITKDHLRFFVSSTEEGQGVLMGAVLAYRLYVYAETFRVFPMKVAGWRAWTRPRTYFIDPPGCPPPSETRPAEPPTPRPSTPHQDPTQRRLPAHRRYGIARLNRTTPHKRAYGHPFQRPAKRSSTSRDGHQDRGQGRQSWLIRRCCKNSWPRPDSSILSTSRRSYIISTTRLATSSCGTTTFHA